MTCFGTCIRTLPFIDKPIYRCSIDGDNATIEYIDYHTYIRNEVKRTYPNHRMEARFERCTDYGPQETY